jgi:hypothetical protein
MGSTQLIYEFRHYKIEKFKHIFWGIISVLSFDEFQIYPEKPEKKNGLKNSFAPSFSFSSSLLLGEKRKRVRNNQLSYITGYI